MEESEKIVMKQELWVSGGIIISLLMSMIMVSGGL